MNKKEWLDVLYYDIGKQQGDFFISGLKKTPDGEVISTKWKKYSEVCFPLNPWDYKKIDWVNQRQILPNEIVLDLEDKERILSIKEKLDRLFKDNYKIYSTGSRGYHIHIFFTQPISETDKKTWAKIFGSDLLKAGEKTMIALEDCPHWKTGMNKQEVKINGRRS